MFKNYIILAFRNLLKNKVASLISVLGLSVAIGCGIVAYLFISRLVMGEASHEHGNTIFQVQAIHVEDGETVIDGFTPAPLGPQVASDQPSIERAVRVQEGRLTVWHNGNEFRDVFRFVDPEYFHMFTVPLKYGSLDEMNDPTTVVLSDRIATKYFGDENPVGQVLTVESYSGALRSYTVRGVTEPFAMQSVANFSILIAYENRGPLGSRGTMESESVDWSELVDATFVQVAAAEDGPAVESALAAYVDVYNANVQAGTRVEGFRLENLGSLVHSADEVRHAISDRLPIAPIVLLSTITLFLFTLACVNYINISLGGANARVKEIGVRKAIGGRKGQLIRQFLVENLVLCLLALGAGVVLAVTLFLPGFGAVSEMQMQLEFARRVDLWYFFAATLALTALISGAYPAFYVASFKPVAIFTGKFKAGGPNRFMQTLLTGQFVLAVVTLIICAGFAMNLSYLQNLDWGYDNQNTLVVHLDPETYDLMYDEASRMAQVEHVAGARTHLGSSGVRVDLSSGGTERKAIQFEVGEHYFDVTRPRLTAGVYPTLPGQVLINTSLAEGIGAQNAVGQTIMHEEREYMVSGIVEDFHYYNFSRSIEPALFVLGDASTFQFLLARIQPGAEEEVVAAMTAAMRQVNPEASLDYYFQDESFDGFFEGGYGINQVFYFTALLTLLLSCAGLFGLVAQHTTSKLKEMSIRKILGASVMQIIHLGNRKFIIMLLIAIAIASPLSYLLLGALLDSFIDYRMDIGIAPFAIAISLIILVAAATVATQVRRLVVVNPAELLRYE